jgi:hypothetical protein
MRLLTARPKGAKTQDVETGEAVTRTAAAFALLLIATSPTHAAELEATGTMFYQSCTAAADIMEGRHLSDEQFEKAPMCFGAVTAIINLEPFLKPEYGMCPPKGNKISYGQIILVIASYLKNHPEQLDQNFHTLAALALNTAWPCPPEK